MRVLCVGRHAFLSEHLCRYFRDAGAQCEPAVGATEALGKAAVFEPHLVVSDVDLVTPAFLDAWTIEPALVDVPMLAVSLTRRPEEVSSAELSGLAAVIYLPGLETEQAVALLASLYRPRGVVAPSWRRSTQASPVHIN
jgi:DNA-binding response OmpR family regulator